MAKVIIIVVLVFFFEILVSWPRWKDDDKYAGPDKKWHD